LGRSGDPRAWLRWGKRRGEGGGHVWLLTLGGRRRQRPEFWPAADTHGGDGRRPVLTVVALRCFPSCGKELRRRGSLRGCLWRRRLPPADGNRGESARTTGGVRRTATAARSSDDGARWGELGHARGEAPPFYRHVDQGIRGAHVEERRRRRTAIVGLGRWALAGLAGRRRRGRAGAGRAFGLGPFQ
jgi:hypothetical protein